MRDIVIYTTPTCMYCKRAKDMLDSLGLKYKEVDLSQDQTKRDEIVKEYNWKTVPAIFIDGELVGGYDDLVVYEAEGGLA